MKDGRKKTTEEPKTGGRGKPKGAKKAEDR